MSYLHCPTCQRAYNVAVQPACPFCPVATTVVDATEDIVAAAEQLARAMARATPAERQSAVARLDHLALPSPDAERADHVPAAMLREIRGVLSPPRPTPPPPPRLLATIAIAVLARLESRPRLRRAAELVRSRVRALAA